MTQSAKHKIITISILLGATSLLPTEILAQESLDQKSLLTSTPAKCVSLKQGRTCYQKIAFRWKTDTAANYCLYQQDKDEPIKCWSQKSQGYVDYHFAQKNSLNYFLRLNNHENSIASTTIEVKWVYKRHSDRYGWRIF